MRQKLILAMVLVAATSAAMAANMYRWVDSDGKVHYTDTPPPATAKKVEQKNLGGNYIEADDLPYASRLAAQRFPVTVYATDCGAPCSDARELLKKRGVPYTLRNPEQRDVENALKKLLGGSLQVPVLVIGNSAPLRGYEAGAWNSALDAAGYPSSVPQRNPTKSTPTAGKDQQPAITPEKGSPSAPSLP
jgi:glutaredoxin